MRRTQFLDRRGSGRTSSELTGVSHVCLAAALSLLAVIASPASGQVDRADGVPRYSVALGGQLNPGLLANVIGISWRQRLYLSRSPLLEQNAIGASAGFAVAPRGVRSSIGLAVQPLSFLEVGAAYGVSRYFANGGGQSYPSPRSAYDSSALSAPRDGPGGSYGLTVQQLTVSAALQAKAGRIMARSAARGSRFIAEPHGGDRVVYDPGYDVVVYKQGWVAQIETDLAYQAASALTVGVRHTLTLAWYPASAYAPGEAHDNPNTPIHRLGPSAAWTIFQHEGGEIDAATLAVSAQWYLEHRYRTGGAVSGALPLLGVAFTLSGDLLH